MEGGRGVRRRDERPAPLRGLSPLSLMLPLNHTDTPPVSFCEAAPVPHVSLWGKEQTSQNITGRRHSQISPGERDVAGCNGSSAATPGQGEQRDTHLPLPPPPPLNPQPWMTSSHRFKAVQPGEQNHRQRSESEFSAVGSAHRADQDQLTAESATEHRGYPLSFSFEKKLV